VILATKEHKDHKEERCLHQMNDNTLTEAIAAASKEIKLELDIDLVSNGWLLQTAKDFLPKGIELPVFMEKVIIELIAAGIEIGETYNIDGKYVKFIAWRGDVGQRVTRARRVVTSTQERDRDFAFWMCLPANVDEYEATQVVKERKEEK